MPNNRFNGILPAVVTTLDGEERFTPGPFERLLDSFYRQDCNGVYVCGQTGEGLLQSPAQRKKVAEVAVRASPKEKSVIVHVGAHNTRETIELARHAASIGAAAVASLPPSGKYSFAEIREFIPHCQRRPVSLYSCITSLKCTHRSRASTIYFSY